MAGKTKNSSDNRREVRKAFTYYMQVTDAITEELIGHLSDISLSGFKLDAEKPLPLNRDFRFRLPLFSDVADKPDMIFGARSKWCRADPIDPFVYNVGFELTAINPADTEIFVRLIEKYGSDKSDNQSINPSRSNRW